eukprot:COSAG02_NODE_15600_length_1157_cov_1.013233_2_plen_96_part_00
MPVRLDARLVDRTPIEKRKVIDFARVSLTAGAATTVSFAVTPEHVAMVNSDGHRSLHSGEFEVLVSHGSYDDGLTASVRVAPFGEQRLETFRPWW